MHAFSFVDQFSNYKKISWLNLMPGAPNKPRTTSHTPSYSSSFLSAPPHCTSTHRRTEDPAGGRPVELAGSGAVAVVITGVPMNCLTLTPTTASHTAELHIHGRQTGRTIPATVATVYLLAHRRRPRRRDPAHIGPAMGGSWRWRKMALHRIPSIRPARRHGERR